MSHKEEEQELVIELDDGLEENDPEVSLIVNKIHEFAMLYEMEKNNVLLEIEEETGDIVVTFKSDNDADAFEDWIDENEVEEPDFLK